MSSSKEFESKEIVTTDSQEKFLINTQVFFEETVADIERFLSAKENGQTTDNAFYEEIYRKLYEAILAGKAESDKSGQKLLIIIGEKHGYLGRGKDKNGNTFDKQGDNKSLVAELMALKIAKDFGIQNCISETVEKINYSQVGFLSGQTRPTGATRGLTMQTFKFAEKLGITINDGCDKNAIQNGVPVSPEERCRLQNEGVKSIMEEVKGDCIMVVGYSHISHLYLALHKDYKIVAVNAFFYDEAKDQQFLHLIPETISGTITLGVDPKIQKNLQIQITSSLREIAEESTDITKTKISQDLEIEEAKEIKQTIEKLTPDSKPQEQPRSGFNK